MPDQVKLEPPPGQDILVWANGLKRGDPPRIFLHIPCVVVGDVMRSRGPMRFVAACVGAEMWRREEGRLYSVPLKQWHTAAWDAELNHAKDQVLAWERWGGLT